MVRVYGHRSFPSLSGLSDTMLTRWGSHPPGREHSLIHAWFSGATPLPQMISMSCNVLRASCFIRAPAISKAGVGKNSLAGTGPFAVDALAALTIEAWSAGALLSAGLGGLYSIRCA